MISEKLLDETELMVCELTSQHAQMVEATEGMRRSADNVSTGMAELFGAEEGVGEHVVHHMPLWHMTQASEWNSVWMRHMRSSGHWTEWSLRCTWKRSVRSTVPCHDGWDSWDVRAEPVASEVGMRAWDLMLRQYGMFLRPWIVRELELRRWH